jgi:hypothetical protein
MSTMSTEVKTPESRSRSPSPHPVQYYELVQRALNHLSFKDPKCWILDRGCNDLLPVRQVLNQVQGPFAGSGTYPEYSWGRDELSGHHLQVGKVDCGSLTNLNVDLLAAHTTPAPFGKGSETVYDEKVRKAREIPGDQFDPETPMYEEGGHFDAHADTLHGDNHLATLVVVLPVAHEGGALEVKVGNDCKTFDLSTPFSDSKGSDCDSDSFKPALKWACFYTDCTHKVLPVTKGRRIILQYDLYSENSEDSQDQQDPQDPEDSADEYSEEGDMDMNERWFGGFSGAPEHARHQLSAHTTSTLKASLTGYFLKHPTQRLAVLLTHRYSVGNLKPQHLKGADNLLWDVLKGDYQTSLTSLVFYNTYDYNYPEYNEYAAYPFNKSDIDELLGETRSAKRRKKDDSDSPIPKTIVVLALLVSKK